eukprot:2374042-Amphidinium_carterae.1
MDVIIAKGTIWVKPQKGGEEALLYFRELKVPALDIASVNEKFGSTVACVGDACGQPSIGLLPSGAGMLRGRTMGDSKVCLVCAKAWEEMLQSKHREGDSDKRFTLTEAVQRFKVLEHAPTSGRVSAGVVPANSVLWVPTGWISAEMCLPETGPLWCGIRQSFFAKHEHAKANLECMRKWADAESSPSVATLDAVIKLYD